MRAAGSAMRRAKIWGEGERGVCARDLKSVMRRATATGMQRRSPSKGRLLARMAAPMAIMAEFRMQ